MVDLKGKTLYEALGVAKDASQVGARHTAAGAAAAAGRSLQLRRRQASLPGHTPHRPPHCNLHSSTLEQSDIRKAFHKLALALHPDKNPGDTGAVDKFQTLQKVYGILSDPDK